MEPHKNQVKRNNLRTIKIGKQPFTQVQATWFYSIILRQILKQFFIIYTIFTGQYSSPYHED